jgi:hypothetical protein
MSYDSPFDLLRYDHAEHTIGQPAFLKGSGTRKLDFNFVGVFKVLEHWNGSVLVKRAGKLLSYKIDAAVGTRCSMSDCIATGSDSMDPPIRGNSYQGTGFSTMFKKVSALKDEKIRSKFRPRILENFRGDAGCYSRCTR